MDNANSDRQVTLLLRLTALAAGVLFVVHFFFTLVYSIAEAPVGMTIRAAARTYTHPVFHQGWKLFAPDVPTCDVQLGYRIFEKGRWSDEIDPLELGGVPNHHKIEFSHHKLTVFLADAIGLECDADEPSDAYRNRIHLSGAYYRCYYYLRRRHEIAHGTLPDSLQMVMRRLSVPHFGGGEVKGGFEIWFYPEPLR